MSHIGQHSQHKRLLGSYRRRQRNKHSRRCAPTESENELPVPRTRQRKRRTARNSARLGAPASTGISQKASSNGQDSVYLQQWSYPVCDTWKIEERGREKVIDFERSSLTERKALSALFANKRRAEDLAVCVRRRDCFNRKDCAPTVA